MNSKKITFIREFIEEYFQPGTYGFDDKTQSFVDTIEELIAHRESNEDRRRDVIVAGIQNGWSLGDIKLALKEMEQKNEEG